MESPPSSWGHVPIHIIAILAVCLAMAFPKAAAQDTIIAYAVPADTEGSQAFGGTLGMDFDIHNPILVTRLGVFDDNSDGLNLTITAKLWDRSIPGFPIELASIDFTPEDPGELIGGSRFKSLPEPIRLEIGFQGTIHAEGYGEGERLRNAGNPPNIVWTTNDGNGSIQFVGTSRYGTTPQWYPDVVDSGVAAQYAAGTFEYETTPALAPGRPLVTIQPGDQQIHLEWPAVTQPAPASTYRISRSTTAEGPFTQLAEVTEPGYIDESLENGTVYFYLVRGVSSSGNDGLDSILKSAAPYAPLPANQEIAYFTPAGTAGTQDFAGPLGMEFDVYNAIIVHQLGVFDDNSDGLKRAITARIYDRDTFIPVAEVYFLEDDGVLIEGMRFKPLPAPLQLEPGFRGLIVADNYGAEERVGNSGTPLWTVNDGNGSVLFVGGGRWGIDPFAYPDNADAGPANRYAAGTFLFETTAFLRPGVPSIWGQLPSEDSQASLFWTAVEKPLVAALYRIFRAPSADGPWTVAGETADTSFVDTGLPNDVTVFHKVVAVGSEGEVSADSNIISVTPAPRRGGIAYINPQFQEGNQAFDGSLGMDFDVVHPIQITRLGVFDEYSDGWLARPIRAAIFDRNSREEIVFLEFTTEEPGELVGGSLFKTLETPLNLPSGFQGTIVASGYGEGERLFNSGNRPDDVALLGTFDGGSLLFVGTASYSATPGAYPDVADGGPANRFGAGTFEFEPAAESPTITITRSENTVQISWTGSGALQSAPSVDGPWTGVPEATSGMELPTGESAAYFRISQ